MPKLKGNVGRAVGVNEFLNTTFHTYKFDGAWAASIGPEPETNFAMLVHGDPKNGKTEFCLQLAKYLTQHGSVYYNSSEQGVSSSLQKALKRNKMDEVSGRIVFGNRETLAQMYERLDKKNSAKIVFIDSQNYLKMTADDFDMLRSQFPSKAFVIICWSEKGRYYTNQSKKIEFQVDVVVWVKDYVAHVRTRFEGGDNYIVWDRKASREEAAKNYMAATDGGMEASDEGAETYSEESLQTAK